MIINYNEFERVKICKGNRYASSYYAVTAEGLHPNKKGECVDCVPLTVKDLIININSGLYKEECEKEYKKNQILHPNDVQELKSFASSIYAFPDHRYTIYEEVYDEKLNRTKKFQTDYAYNKWTGFIGYDFDVPKSFTKQQRRLIGRILKEILAKNLMNEKWFIGSLISTGGHGTHCLTAVKVPAFYNELNIEHKKKYHHCVYWTLLNKMLSSLIELMHIWNDDHEDEELTLDDVANFADTRMLSVVQTVNISPIEDNMLVNVNFVYEELKEIESSYMTLYDDLGNDALNYTDIDEMFIKIHGLPDDIRKSDKFLSSACKNYKIVECSDFDIHILDNCPGPWHFEHKRSDNEFWTGNQIIHTLFHFFNIDTIKAIWEHPKFYDENPKDWLRFIDTWDFNSDVPPNFKLMNWLNKNCGMNLHYAFDDTEDITTIELKDDEYLYDKKDILLENLKDGFNIIDSGPGTGKTTFFKLTFVNNTFDPVLNLEPSNILLTEPYNSICSSKFKTQEKNGELNIITGSKRIKWIDANNIVTNYNHVIQMSEEDIKKTDLFVIDESHLIFSEYYRHDILVKLIEYLKMFKKVIFMTGTPSIESKYFNECNVIKINKSLGRIITHEFLTFYPTDYVNNDGETKIWNHFEPWNLSAFIHTLVEGGKKVYVYDANISYQKCLKFKEMLDDLKIAIYHKKELDDEGLGDIEYIDTNHRLGEEYDVLISSCYFGVGNDLYDGDEGKYNKVATIICGIHTPNEIFQVASRWRNVKEVNIYTIINDNEQKERYDYDKIYDHEKKKMIYEREDALNRNKSITFFNKTIKNISDDGLEFCACVKSLDIYGKTIDYINEKLSEYGVNIYDRIMPLYYNLDNYTRHLQYSDILKRTRNNKRTAFIMNIINNYDDLHSDRLNWEHTDSKIEEWERTTYRLAKILSLNEFKEECNYICKSSLTDSFKLFIELYYNRNNKDYNEIYCLYKCVSNMVEEDYFIHEYLTYNMSIIMKTFVIYLTYVNKGESYKLLNAYNIKEYFNRWKKTIYDFNFIFHNKILFDILFDEEQINIVVNGIEETYGELSIDKYNDNTERSKYANNSYEQEMLNKLIYWHANKQVVRNEHNKVVGKKKIIITDQFKHKEKYRLEIGQKFESCTDLSEYAKTSKQTISSWMIKGWIRQI